MRESMVDILKHSWFILGLDITSTIGIFINLLSYHFKCIAQFRAMF
jgi:hypothetical protein